MNLKQEHEELTLSLSIQNKLKHIQKIHEAYGYYINTRMTQDDCEYFIGQVYDSLISIGEKIYVEEILETPVPENEFERKIWHNMLIEEIMEHVGDGTQYVMQILKNKKIL